MIRFLLIFALSCLIYSCTTSDIEKKEVAEEVTYLSNRIKNGEIIDATGKLPTEQRKCNSDSLLQYFDFIKIDFSQKSYYHKTWWRTYWLRAHILMAGVDSSGNYFLTMTTFFPSEVNTMELKNTDVWVYYEKDTVKTNSAIFRDVNLKIYNQNWGWIGTWNPLHLAYDQSSCSKVMKFIYDNRNKNLHYFLVKNNKKIDGPYSINKKNRNAIAQCFELGNCLQSKQELLE